MLQFHPVLALRPKTWFHNHSFHAWLISAICRLCLGHTHLPAHTIRFCLLPFSLSSPFHLNNRITRTFFTIPFFMFSPLAPISTKTIAGLRPSCHFYSFQILLGLNHLPIFLSSTNKYFSIILTPCITSLGRMAWPTQKIFSKFLKKTFQTTDMCSWKYE